MMPPQPRAPTQSAVAPVPLPKRRRISRTTGYVLGLWLAGVFVTSALARIFLREVDFLDALLASAGLWPVLYFTFSRNRFFPKRIDTDVKVALTVFMAFAGASVFVSPIPLISVSYYFLTLGALFLSLQFNSALTPAQYETGFKIYAFCAMIALVAFAAYDYVPGVRLGNGKGILNPNSIGLVSMSAITAAFAIRRTWLRICIMAPTVMVLILTDSRSAALASLVAILIVLFIRTKAGSSRRLITIFFWSAAVGIIAILNLDAIVHHAESFFAIHNRYRGIGTGATGRLEAWTATWALFLSHPIVGVGFRAHEHFITVESSSHNGYIAMFAEIGLFGTLAVFYFVAAGLRNLLRQTKQADTMWSGTILLGICIGYLIIAVFERYLLNMGNPTSLIFLLGIMQQRSRT